MTRKILGKSTLGTAVLFSTLAASGQAFAAPSVTVYGDETIATLDTSAATAMAYGIASEGLTTATQALDGMSAVVFTTSVKNPGGYTITLSKAAFDSAATYNLVVWKDLNSDDMITDLGAAGTDGTCGNEATDYCQELYYLGDGSGNIVSCEETTSNTVLECGPLTGAMGVYAGVGNSATNLSSGSKLLIATGVSTGTTNSDITTSDLIFDTDTTKSALSNGSSVTISIAETTNTGTDNGSGSANLATVTEQYAFCVTTTANGVIDLNADPSATLFDDGGATDTIVVDYQDFDAVDTTCGETSSVGDFLINAAYAADAITVTLTPSSKSGITGDIVSSDGDADANDDLATTSTTSTYTNVDTDFVDFPVTYTITVDGTTTLAERDFTVSLKGVDDTTTTYLSDEDAGSWNMNGYTAYIPHMLVGNSSYQTFIKVVNLSDRDADVMGEAVICDSNHENCVTELAADLGTVSAGSSMFIIEADLVNAFDNLVSGSSYQVDGTLIVNGPIDQVAVTAITKTVADGSRATMSVLTEDYVLNNANAQIDLPLKQ